MMFVTHSPGQSARISLVPDVAPATPVGDFFRDGPICVRVVTSDGSQLQPGVELPPLLEMRRGARAANCLPSDLP